MQIVAYGGPEVMQLRDVPDPVPGDHEIVADVMAVSLNPGDVKVRRGLRPVFVKQFPHTLGRDFSGVVRAAGRGVKDFKPGQNVFGILELNHEGTYAEAVAIKSDLVAHKPDSLSHAEVVSVALTGLTALYSLEDYGKVKAGETILIHGGSGGIGAFSVQYARHMGARVFATASGRNRDYVLGLGAERCIDYASEDFTKIVPKCDIVFDMVGGEVQRRSVGVLRPGGRLVIISPSTKDAEGVRDDITILRPLVNRDRRHLERIVELVTSGAVRPPEIRRMPLREAPAAHEIAEAQSFRGKIILEPR